MQTKIDVDDELILRMEAAIENENSVEIIKILIESGRGDYLDGHHILEEILSYQKL